MDSEQQYFIIPWCGSLGLDYTENQDGWLESQHFFVGGGIVMCARV